MNKEIEKVIEKEIERKEGVETHISEMTFTFDELKYYLEFYEREILKKIVKELFDE